MTRSERSLLFAMEVMFLLGFVAFFADRPDLVLLASGGALVCFVVLWFKHWQWRQSLKDDYDPGFLRARARRVRRRTFRGV